MSIHSHQLKGFRPTDKTNAVANNWSQKIGVEPPNLQINTSQKRIEAAKLNSKPLPNPYSTSTSQQPVPKKTSILYSIPNKSNATVQNQPNSYTGKQKPQNSKAHGLTSAQNRSKTGKFRRELLSQAFV